jgi:predicted O-methyltransferase YrrM
MNLRPVTRYAEHLLLARYRKGHGVHSPFFFDIINTLHRNKSDKGLVYKMAEAWRRELLGNRSTIFITDYGTGTSGPRRICDIASQSSVNKRLGRVLSFFASGAGESDIIEMGTSLGLGTVYLALSNPGARIITIEGCPELASFTADGFKKMKISNVELVNGEFDEVLRNRSADMAKSRLVYIDGNHSGDALKRYFNYFAATENYDRVIIADDIDYSSDMNSAWMEISDDRRVTGALDFGRAGVLFFRQGLSKQYYRVRY